MQKKTYILIGFLVILVGGFGFVLLRGQIERALAGAGDSASGWAWIGLGDSGDNATIGYLSFNSTNCDSDGDGFTDQVNFANCPIGDPITDYGVDIDGAGLFSGYAWAGLDSGGADAWGLGWISFEDLAGCPQPPCEARLNFATDEVSGWARACAAFQAGCSGALEPEAGGWDGWIKLRGQTDPPAGAPEEYGVWYDDSDPLNAKLMGWAWGGNQGASLAEAKSKASIGWVSFNVWNPEPPPPPPDPILPPPPPVVPPGPNQKICSAAYCQQYVSPRSQYAACNNSSSCSGANQVYLGEVQSTDCNAAAGSYCVCCADDWSVVIENPNSPPDAPTGLVETLNGCGWGLIPQVALGLKIRLSWDYSDPEGDAQIAYEIQVDDDASFASPRLDYIAEPSGSADWYLNLDEDNALPPDASDPDNNIVDDWPVPPATALAWNTVYYWRVRVKDVGSEKWSGWSPQEQFQTPQHALPNPDFTVSPILASKNEVIQVCSRQDAGVCPADVAKCYNAFDVEVNCANPEDPIEMNYFVWTIVAGAPGEFVGDSVWRKYNPFPIILVNNKQSTSTNPQMKFSNAGTYVDALEMKLEDGLGSCAGSKNIQITIPLPKWKEISP